MANHASTRTTQLCVDRLGEGPEPNATLRQRRHGLNQMRQRAAERPRAQSLVAAPADPSSQKIAALRPLNTPLGVSTGN